MIVLFLKECKLWENITPQPALDICPWMPQIIQMGSSDHGPTPNAPANTERFRYPILEFLNIIGA